MHTSSKGNKSEQNEAHVDDTGGRVRVEALLETAADLKHAQAVARTGSWRLDVRRNELSWSDETYRMFGVMKNTPMTYEAFISFVHPDDRAIVDSAWNRALNGEPYDLEHRIVVDSEVRWVREKAELEFDSSGELLGGFGAVQDITDRKRAEDKIIRQNRILNGINAIFKGALTCESEEQLGETCLRVAEEITGSKFGFIGEVGPDGLFHDIAVSDSGWDICRLHQHTSNQRKMVAHCGVCGLYGPVLVEGANVLTNTPLLNPDDIRKRSCEPAVTSFLGVPLKSGERTLGMIGVANREGGYERDQLEALEMLAPAVLQALQRWRTEQALIRSEKLVSVGRLAATIAHEINNPLAAALNALYLVSHDKNLPSGLRGFTETAEQELQRAAQIVRRTLSFYREPNSRGVVDIVAIISEVMTLYGSQAKNKVVEIATRFDHDCGQVVGTGSELRQLISNLLANSLDAVSARGVVHLRVARHTLPGGAHAVRLTVADKGTGIEPRNFQRIFEPFFTTKQNVGTGLGLWIAAQIVKTHGGTMRVRSRVDHGTVFLITLPAADSAEVSLPAAAAHAD